MQPGEVTRYLLERSGVMLPSHKRSLWVHGETSLQFDAGRRLISLIMADRPHVRLVVTSRSPQTLRYLRSVFVDDRTLPVPGDLMAVSRRFFRKLQIRHILLLEGGRSFPRKALHLAVAER